jgi:Family of unknown function (DUF6913)
MGLKGIVKSFLLKWQIKKTNQASYSLNSSIDSPARILVLYPHGPEGLQHAYKMLTGLSTLFTNSEFCLIGSSGTSGGKTGKQVETKCLSPQESDLTWSGLPNKTFINKIKQQKGDLLIDLSIQKDFFNAYIASCSGVPIRIGNYGTWGSPVYNLEIKTNYLQSEEKILNSFVDVLRTFKAGINN